MKKIIPFPDDAESDREVIEQEALEWLIKLDRDTPPSAEMRAALTEWMARSPAHTRELESLGAFWADLSLTELNIPLAKPGTSRGSDSLPGAQLLAGQGAMVLGRRAWLAAAGVLGVTLLVQQLLWPGSWFKPRIDAANGIYATAIGQQATIPLVDGSVIYLNTQSQLQVDYREGYRDIRLVRGEAHFDVASNQQSPFRVFAGKRRVQAVGTAFTVHLRQQDLDVLVTEGKVELAAQTALPEMPPPQASAPTPQNDPAYYVAMPVKSLGLLAQGQGATIVVAQHNTDPDGQRHKVKMMDAKALKQKDAWRQGLLLFAGDSLEDVVAEMSRYTSVNITIADPALKSIRIGGQFRVDDIAGMFAALETNFGLSIVQLDGQRVHITAANTSSNTSLNTPQADVKK